MGSSLAAVYTTTKTSSVESFKHGCKFGNVANMATFFARGVLRRSSFLGNLKLSDKKLGLQRTLN
jgi:hypothetical protein